MSPRLSGPFGLAKRMLSRPCTRNGVMLPPVIVRHTVSPFATRPLSTRI